MKIAVPRKYGVMVESQMTTSQIVSMEMLAKASTCGLMSMWMLQDMECFHEEIFGPLVTIVRARDFDHALHLANASPYGLSSAIYTNDRLEAYRYKTGIKAGMTGINNSTTGAEAHLPFGGVKGSGNGTRESGIWVIEAYSYWHAVNDELSGKLQLAQMDVDEIEMEEADADYGSLA